MDSQMIITHINQQDYPILERQEIKDIKDRMVRIIVGVQTRTGMDPVLEPAFQIISLTEIAGITVITAAVIQVISQVRIIVQVLAVMQGIIQDAVGMVILGMVMQIHIIILIITHIMQIIITHTHTCVMLGLEQTGIIIKVDSNGR